MKHHKGLLDTSTVLRLYELKPEDLPAEVVISAITLAELSVGPLVTTDEQERAARLAQVQQAESDYGLPLSFDAAAARAFAQVTADIRSAGSKSKACAFDALIAAIAKASGLPIYTFNPDDFAAVKGIEVVVLPPASSEPNGHSCKT
ncbi:MAG: type II toxin-antitoxin system VapC family toxin [Micrococcales bacterium]|nr:type II toxin-antitoxin system VapC family toxin [Micrococcales bacterium]